jgi:hypothetical protein
MGGDVGRLVPLLNDVIENVRTILAIREAASESSLLLTLLKSQFPSELYELLRLTLGPESGGPTSQTKSLRELYAEAGAPPRPALRLQEFQATADMAINRTELRDYRNRVGAHIDDETPWEVLDEGIRTMDLATLANVTEGLLLQLELCAVEPGGPLPLMFPSRRLTALITTQPTADIAYDNVDASSALSSVPSSLPPAGFDSGHTIWVGGAGQFGAAAVAGMQAGRVAELKSRLAERKGESTG